MRFIKIVIHLLASGNGFARIADNTGGKRCKRIPVVYIITRVDKNHGHDRVHTMVGKDPQSILLYTVGKVFAAAILNDLQKRHIGTLDVGVINLE